MFSRKISISPLIGLLFFAGSAMAGNTEVRLTTTGTTIAEGGATATLQVRPNYQGSNSSFNHELTFAGEGIAASAADISLSIPAVVACTPSPAFDLQGRTAPTLTVTDGSFPYTMTFAGFDASGLSCNGGGGGGGTPEEPAGGCSFVCPITVTAVNDQVDEGNVNEGFAIVVQGGVVNESQVSLNIQDNDFAGIIVSKTVIETHEEGETSDSFTVKLATQPVSGKNVTVNVAMATCCGNGNNGFNGEGTLSGDGNTDVESIALVFNSGNWDSAKTITVNGQDDAPANPSDGDFSYQVSVSTGNVGGEDDEYDNLSGPTVDVTNIDNDNPGQMRIKTGFTNIAGNEGTSATVTIERIPGLGKSGAAEVTWTLAEGTAKFADFTGTTGTVSWNDDQDGDRAVNIPLIADGLWEAAESFTLTLNTPVGAALVAPTQSTITINQSNDISFAIGNTAVTEGNAGTVAANLTVTRSGGTIPAGENITLTCATMDVSALTTDGGMDPSTGNYDYVPGCANVVFAPGDNTKQVSIPVNGDTKVEANETFKVQLGGAPARVTLTGGGAGTVTINNDDDEPDAGIISISDVTANPVSEDGASVTVTLSRIGGAADGEVSVVYYTQDGTAVSGGDSGLGLDDFDAIPEGAANTKTWADLNDDDMTFTVTINPDDFPEGNETFKVLIKPVGAEVLGTSFVNVTISGNDQPGSFSIDPDAYFVNEGAGTVTVTVNRFDGNVGPASVIYWTVDGTAKSGGDAGIGEDDFDEITEGAANTVSWLDTQDGGRTFDVTINPDAVVEGAESFTVKIKAVGSEDIVEDTGTVTINANGGVSPGNISISPTFRSRSESAGQVSFNVSRNGGDQGEVTVKWYTQNGTAQAPGDYNAVADTTLTWASGNSATKVVTVTGLNDSVPAGDPGEAATETFTVRLKDATGGASITPNSQATVEIRDDDADSPGVLNIFDATVDEDGGTVMVKVSRQFGVDGEVRVDYATATTGSADAVTDFVHKNGTLIWADGDGTDKFITITIVDDAPGVIEPPEHFNVVLSNPKGAGGGDPGKPEIGDGTAKVTIFDNDGSGQISVGDASVTEECGAPLTEAVVIITRSNDNNQKLALQVQTFWGTAQDEGGSHDYNFFQDDVVWEAGDTSDTREVRVKIICDSEREGSEFFYVAITSISDPEVDLISYFGVVTISDWVPIPTLNQWTLILLILLLGALGATRLRSVRVNRH